MAGKSFPISLIIKAVDQATAPLRKVSAQLGDISKQVSSAGKALTVGVTAPLAAMAAGSVAAFGRFEAGMANVSTLVDTSVESMDAMGRAVLDIGKRVPVGLGDLTEALATARGTGVSAADAMSVLENSAKLGVAALGSTKDAVKMVVGAMNAWQLKGEDVKGLYNTLFQATAAGSANLSELSQGFGSVAGVAANAGVKLDEYVAAAEALTTTTRPASEAHTQLKAVLSGLTRQTALTRAVFQKLGAKDVRGLIEAYGGLVPALERIKGVLGGSDTKMLELLGSTEALTAALDLTGSQAETFKGLLGSIRSSSDGVSKAFEKQASTGKATMQVLQNQLEGVAISVGRVLVPVLQQLAPVLESLASKWEAMGSEGQKSIIIAAGAAAALGPTITVLGNLATAISATSKAFVWIGAWAKYLYMMRNAILTSLVVPLKAAIASVWAFTTALLANPITWVVAGVVALGAAAYLLYENWEPVKAFFTELWDGIVSVFKQAWEIISPIVEGMVSVAAMPLRWAASAGDSLFGTTPERPALGAPAERPTLGAAQMAPGAGVLAPQQSETRVVVDFSNLPRGARVSEAPGGTAPLDLSLGYGMVGG